MFSDITVKMDDHLILQTLKQGLLIRIIKALPKISRKLTCDMGNSVF
jgi:hypothetical protein